MILHFVFSQRMQTPNYCAYICKSARVYSNAFLTTTLEHLRAQNVKTSNNVELLQPLPIVAADTLLEIVKAVTSAVSSPDEHV
jgi:hypothetical protein